jgi:phage replication-related protein YjqB (UPF0714/DUF867 family)
MADKYPDFATQSEHETAGVDFGILLRRSRDSLALVAPHGGGIEAGTSEIADACAGAGFSFYAFEGLKRSSNGSLHITSTRFDEPLCLALIAGSKVVVTIHGEESPGRRVFLGGLDDELAGRIGEALRAAGFTVARHPNPALQGREPTNLCNRGKSGAGVQLELSKGLRRQMFEDLTREGRKHPTQRLADFAEALSEAVTPPE